MQNQKSKFTALKREPNCAILSLLNERQLSQALLIYDSILCRYRWISDKRQCHINIPFHLLDKELDLRFFYTYYYVRVELIIIIKCS